MDKEQKKHSVVCFVACDAGIHRYQYASSSSSCSASKWPSEDVSGKAVVDGPGGWTPANYVEDPDEITNSCLQNPSYVATCGE